MLQTLVSLPLLLLLLTAVPGLTGEPHHGLLHVEFLQYAVPDSRLASGRYCDSLKIFSWERRVSACDPQVNLCVGAAGDFKSCSVAKIALPWIKNSDSVSFGSKIGGTPNPVTRPFTRLPETLSLSSTIYDHDRVGSPDLIETLTSSVKPSKIKQTVQLSSRTHLRLRLWVSCATNYYGYLCRQYNHCHTKPCGHHGRCVNLATSFRCSCTAGWSGARCDKNDTAGNPCAGRKAKRFHACRLRYKHGKPTLIAIEYVTKPVAKGEKCVMNRSHRTVTGVKARSMCHG